MGFSCVHSYHLQTAACLPVMATFAQRLPIAVIPEEILIPTMRQNVVNNCGGRQSSVALALQAQGVSAQVSLP
jgi:hypothetical protein